MGRTSIAVILSACLSASTLLSAADWPRFRGPNGDGVAADDKSPPDLSLDRNLVWKARIPQGNSSPILVDGRLFLTAHEGLGRIVLCLDTASGKELWRKSIPRPRPEASHTLNGPATPTLATDGRNVFAFFPELGLVSYSRDGVERWRAELGPFHTVQGVATSPIYAEGNVLLFIDQLADSYLAAFDASSGKQRWKVEHPSGWAGGYSTPTLYKPANGPTQLIAFGASELTGYHAKTGERLWWTRGIGAPIALPLVHGDVVYTTQPQDAPPQPFSQASWLDANKDGKVTREEVSGNPAAPHFMGKMLHSIDRHFGDGDGAVTREEWNRAFGGGGTAGGLSAFPLGGRGEIPLRASRWNVSKGAPWTTSPLLYRDVLYTVRNGGIVTSYNPVSGEVFKQARLQDALGEYYASPIAGGGRIYLISKEGKLSVVKAGEQWETEARIDLDDQVIATPALAGGHLYVRTAQMIYSFGK